MHSADSPRVLHIVNSLECGGTERALLALLRQLGKDAASHAIVTSRRCGVLAAQLPSCVAVHSLGISSRTRTAGVSVAAIARRFRADVLHARNTGCWTDAAIAGALTRTPTLLGFHGWENAEGFDRRQRRRIRWMSCLGTRFTSVSLSGIERLHTECNIPRERIPYLPNGVDVALFQRHDVELRSRVRPALGAAPGDILIGSVGSLRTIKGFHVLLSAFARCRVPSATMRLAIAGDGPERESLSSLASDLGIAHRVSFLGHRDDIPEFLPALDLYVCSSLGEGMSNALLEAMATGLPIVATDAGDNSVILRHGIDGLIVPRNDTDALAKGIAAFMNDAPMQTQFAAAALERAREFDLASMAQRYDALYRNLVDACDLRPRSAFPVAAMTG